MMRESDALIVEQFLLLSLSLSPSLWSCVNTACVELHRQIGSWRFKVRLSDT